MKILVFGHHLVVGGTPLNSIELAAALRDIHGHEVVYFATPGPMLRLVREKRLRYLPAPEGYVHPSPARMSAVRDAVRQEKPDVIHVWDWYQCLEAYYTVYLGLRAPMVVTDMFMHLTRVLPKTLPTTFGTPELVDQARAAGRRRVELLLPPVDVQANAPGAVDSRAFRDKYGLDEQNVTLVTVSRLSLSMKFEGLGRAIAAVEALGAELPLELVIVGDGDARKALEEMARPVNARLGRPAIRFVGELVDPRPAYEAADIVIGMGGSALRGMAFAKPVIIIGEEGFSEIFSPQTAGHFYYYGIFGRGGAERGTEKLISNIRALLSDPKRLAPLGEFSRKFVVRHFSLESVSKRLSDFCESAAATAPAASAAFADGVRSAAVYLRERLFLRRSVDMVQNRKAEQELLVDPAPAGQP